MNIIPVDLSAAPALRKSPTLSFDAIAMRRIADGDRSAMEQLYLRHRVGIFRFIMRLVVNPAVADDIVSEVFLEVWRRAGTYKGHSAVSTWLLGIARLKTLSAIRRQPSELLTPAHELIEDSADDPEIAAEKSETRAILRKCLAELSSDHREIIDLVYYHGRKISEVAEILGISEGTVKTRMFYARKNLAELLDAARVGPSDAYLH
jgi:RNA polymerase sigma-70 factor (ECF subfamily)